MRTRKATTPHHLTKEQDEQRLRGLRALARLIARAYLAGATGDGAQQRGGGPQREEDGHGG